MEADTIDTNQIDTMTSEAMIEQACTHIMSSNLPKIERFLIVLLLRNGLRVSEICNTSNIRIVNKYQVYVFCSKNKVWRQCNTAEASVLLDDDVVAGDLIFWKRNRQYYYRVLKGLLPGVETNREANQAVTHAARNIQAQQAFEVTESPQATRLSIGNTSDNATSKYITRNQRKAYQKTGIISPVSGRVASVEGTAKGVIRSRRK